MLGQIALRRRLAGHKEPEAGQHQGVGFRLGHGGYQHIVNRHIAAPRQCPQRHRSKMGKTGELKGGERTWQNVSAKARVLKSALSPVHQ